VHHRRRYRDTEERDRQLRERHRGARSRESAPRTRARREAQHEEERRRDHGRERARVYHRERSERPQREAERDGRDDPRLDAFGHVRFEAAESACRERLGAQVGFDAPFARDERDAVRDE
jgi:hypothetical protein